MLETSWLRQALNPWPDRRTKSELLSVSSPIFATQPSLVNLTAGILDAVADRLLVNIQPDVIADHLSW
jgi:hypothetical protein